MPGRQRRRGCDCHVFDAGRGEQLFNSAALIRLPNVWISGGPEQVARIISRLLPTHGRLGNSNLISTMATS